MRSIPTIFVWDNNTHAVINKVARGCDWVFQGKGIATRKWDGVAILVENGKVSRRHEWRTGEPVPVGFVRLSDPDPKKPHKALPGWVPVPDTFKTKPKGSDERALKEAWDDKCKQLTHALWAKMDAAEEDKRRAGKIPDGSNPYAPVKEARPWISTLPDGTYELCGPKIRGNHERLQGHVLFEHGGDSVRNVPRQFDKLKDFLEKYEGEGIVFHNQLPGHLVQMAKIKRRDFGFFTRLSPEDREMAYGQKEEEVVNTSAS